MLPVSRRKPLVESANWRLKKVEVFLAYKVQTVQLYLVLVTNKQTEKHLRNQVPTTNQIINHEFQTSNIIFSKQNKKLISKSQPFLKPFFPPPFLPVVSGVSSLWDPPPGFPDNKAQISVACSPRSQMSPLKRKRFAGQGTPTSNKKRRLQTKQTKKWNLLLYSFCFFLVPPFFNLNSSHCQLEPWQDLFHIFWGFQIYLPNHNVRSGDIPWRDRIDGDR